MSNIYGYVIMLFEKIVRVSMKQKEKNRFHKRVERYAKVSKAAAGVGVRIAKARWGIKQSRQKQAELLRRALGDLKGPVMKIAQLLVSIPDVVPEEYAFELAQLQANAPPMGWAFVKRRMLSELGSEWEKKFKKFKHEASYAASLGQVHSAVGLDGRKLACKLQYPDMISAVEADLKQLKFVLTLFEQINRGVSTKEIQHEIADCMREELDYIREAKHIRIYHEILDNVHAVLVPEVVDDLSTDRLLTMTWLEGERLVQVANMRPLKDRNCIAANMFRAWYVPFYEYGVIHGDPHLGNYTVRKDNSVNLLDFGCVRIFRPELIKAVIKLYYALMNDDSDLAVEAYKMWGFSNINKELIDILNVWAKFVYAPFLKDKASLIEETNTGMYGRAAAFKVHRELRKFGGVSIPREFVFIDRASIGLGAVFLRLRASVNWHRLFHELIKEFDAFKLAKRQKTLLKKHKLVTQ